MYDKYAARAFGNMEGQLPAGVLQEFVGLFANCQLPLSHNAPVEITAAPDNQQRLYIDQLFQDGGDSITNPVYSTLTVNNPYSVFVDGDNPYFDFGTSLWAWGVSWWQTAIVNQQYVNNSRVRNLTINNLIKDGYKFEDINVVVDITFDLSDPCNPAAYPVWKSIKVLVQDKDASSDDDEPEQDEQTPSGGSQNTPSGNAPVSTYTDAPGGSPPSPGDGYGTGTESTSGNAPGTNVHDPMMPFKDYRQEGYPSANDPIIPSQQPSQDED
jgi:hypothetical protein